MARLRIASACLIAAAFAGCAQVVVDGRNIDGHTWRALSVDGRPTILGSEPTLRFERGVPQGSGGCNSYGSGEPVRISFGALEMPEMLMTVGACLGPNGDNLPVMAIESAYWNALNAGDRIGFRDDQLVISGTAGEIVFSP